MSLNEAQAGMQVGMYTTPPAGLNLHQAAARRRREEAGMSQQQRRQTAWRAATGATLQAGPIGSGAGGASQGAGEGPVFISCSGPGFKLLYCRLTTISRLPYLCKT